MAKTKNFLKKKKKETLQWINPVNKTLKKESKLTSTRSRTS